ncbi:MAG: signal peptidase II [Lachnospiraceae bacterium]|nr:signal peptidase II [Lachnospiraceae bacterium]
MAVIGFAALAFGIFVLDLLLKNYMEKNLEEGESRLFCKGRLLIRKYHNKGAFLDVGEKKQGLVTAFSLGLTLFMTIIFLSTFSMRGNSTFKAGLALLLGGAYSNTYDRLTRKYVVDYVSFPVKNRRFRRIVFNISDFCIMIGALLLALGEIRRK